MKPLTGYTESLLFFLKHAAQFLKRNVRLKRSNEIAKENTFRSTSDPDNDKTLGRALVIGYIILLIILSISQVVSTFAQAPSKGLQIGDTIPEKIWRFPLQVAGHHENKSSITLNDYRGKLIILDFWATWCGSCIAAMPGSHQLENQFKDRLVILPVTYEPYEKAALFLKTNAYIRDLNLFSVTGDTVLKRLFPHRVIPHYVWIGREGVVKAFTGSERLNITAITDALNDHYSPVLKNDPDPSQPLFLSTDLQNSRLLSFSLLTQGVHTGLPGGARFMQRDGITYRRIFTNSSLYTMYQVTAHQLFKEKGLLFNPKKFIVEVKDQVKLDYRDSSLPKEQWNSENLYNCDFILPPHSAKDFYAAMLGFMNRSLPYYGRIEKRKMKCYALVKWQKNTGIKRVKGPPGLRISLLTAKLNGRTEITMPVVDETGLDVPVELVFPEETTFEGIVEVLHRANLHLIEVQRDLEVFVLGDRPASLPAE